ncbi:hypothetical protein QR680_006051 [Steinernema hermaphroditum]|uniref:Nuclear receptor domain-containing protein n=1 Tax=Steinernema hermaphroditum TaxID=289476 RepID=A0AA39HU72_9BILA|nr:hypothetical protein QR680_006051 [Steinernema hermaphroditum]
MSLAGDKDDRICQVCGNIAHGIHFHVVSCRACAAFFRRSAKDGETYRCTRVMKECDVTRNSCRYCRLQKCKQLGMNLDRLEGKYQKQKKVVENEPNCSSPPDSVVDDGSLPSVDVESHNFKYDANSQMLKVLGILNEKSTIKHFDSWSLPQGVRRNDS